jgi:hypothetical protein
MRKSKAKPFEISNAQMLAIRASCAALLLREPGGQRRRNLQRHLSTVELALRGRGFLV